MIPVRLTHAVKAESPMLVTLSGIVIFVRVRHQLNAHSAIIVTLLVTVKLPVLPPGHWMSVV